MLKMRPKNALKVQSICRPINFQTFCTSLMRGKVPILNRNDRFVKQLCNKSSQTTYSGHPST